MSDSQVDWVTRWPDRLTRTSPGRRPARSAGPPGSISPTMHPPAAKEMHLKPGQPPRAKRTQVGTKKNTYRPTTASATRAHRRLAATGPRGVSIATVGLLPEYTRRYTA